MSRPQTWCDSSLLPHLPCPCSFRQVCLSFISGNSKCTPSINFRSPSFPAHTNSRVLLPNARTPDPQSRNVLRNIQYIISCPDKFMYCHLYGKSSLFGSKPAGIVQCVRCLRLISETQNVYALEIGEALVQACNGVVLSGAHALTGLYILHQDI